MRSPLNAVEIFRIYKLGEGEIGMEADRNSKDLAEGDVKKIENLIKLWKKVTIRQVA